MSRGLRLTSELECDAQQVRDVLYEMAVRGGHDEIAPLGSTKEGAWPDWPPLGSATVGRYICRAILCKSAAHTVARSPSVCLPRSCILSKRINIYL